MQVCPSCKLLNPDAASQCDCGHELARTLKRQESDDTEIWRFVAKGVLIVGVMLMLSGFAYGCSGSLDMEIAVEQMAIRNKQTEYSDPDSILAVVIDDFSSGFEKGLSKGLYGSDQELAARYEQGKKDQQTGNVLKVIGIILGLSGLVWELILKQSKDSSNK